MSRIRFRVNLHSLVNWMSRNSLLQNRRDICNLSDSNGIRTYNHLVCMSSLTKRLSVRLRIKWLWVRILFLSLKHCFPFYSLFLSSFSPTGKRCSTVWSCQVLCRRVVFSVHSLRWFVAPPHSSNYTLKVQKMLIFK